MQCALRICTRSVSTLTMGEQPADAVSVEKETQCTERAQKPRE